MSNPFDQFDAAPAKAGANPFDQFDNAADSENELSKRLRAAGGGVEAVGSMLSGIPAQIAGGLVGASNFIGSGGDIEKARKAQQYVEDTNFGFGKYEPKSEYGKIGQEALGAGTSKLHELGGDLGEAVGGSAGRATGEFATDATLNFLPIPGAKLVGKVGEGLRREFGPKEPLQNVKDIPEEAPPAAPAAPNPFDQFDPAAQQEMPFQFSEQSMADSVARDKTPGQTDMFSNEGIDTVPRGNAPPEIPPLPERQVPPPIDNMHQMEIDDSDHGYMANQYGGGQGLNRIDENGIPIRADRSMEAQNLENPLQRNLWGDELPRQSAQEAARGITAAIDRMPPGEARDAGIGMLSGVPKGQRGAIDVGAVKEAIDNFRAGKGSGQRVLEAYKGAFDKDSMDYMQAQMDHQGTRNAVVLMSPDQFHDLAAKRSPEFMQGNLQGFPHPDDLRGDIKKGLASSGGLRDIPELHTRTQDGVAQVIGHEGRHRMDVFKEMGIGAVPVMIRDVKEPWGQAHSIVGEHEYEIPNPAERQAQPYPLILNNRLRVPQSQRGAVDIGPGLTPSPAARLTKDDPAVVAAGAALDKRAKENVVNKIVGNAYNDDITTPEAALAAAQKAKDIGPVAAARMKSVGSGINSAALSSNNPVMKFARYMLRQAEAAANTMSEKFITGKDGLAPKWNKLSAAERNDVMAVLQKQDRAQRWYSPTELDEAGFNAKQMDVILHVQKMEQLKLQTWNEKRAEVGLPPVEDKPGHFPGNFTGDYRTLVRDKKGNVIGFVGTNTKWGHGQVIKGLKEAYPEATFESLGRKSLAGMGRSADSVAMSELARVMSENSPEFAALQDKVQHLIAQNADKLYGADQHALGKKGGKDYIFGTEGNKPWKNATENTNEAMSAYKNYWDEGMRSHMNLPAETQIKTLLNSPDLAHMPNVRSYMDKYMNHLTGRSVSDFGRAMDTLLDTLPRALGIGPSYIRATLGQTTKRTGQLLMGFANLGHSAVQMLQVPAMSVPQFVNIAKQFNIPIKTVGTAQAAAIRDTAGLIKEMITGEKSWRDRNTRAAMDFASEHGMRHLSEFQDLSKTEQSASGRALDSAIDANRMVPEITTRPYTFFTLFRMLEDVPHLTLDQKLHTALNATDEAMINYSPREKPMIYGDMGQMGKLTGSLSTFKHGAMAQGGRLVKGVANGNLTPLAVFAAANFALAGVRGIYGYDDADSIVKWLTEKGGNRQSIRELLLDPHIQSEVVKSGALSAYTGLDLAGRVNVNGFIPESPVAAVIGPFGSKIAKVGELAGKAAKNLTGDGNGPIDFKNLALELMPGGPIHHNVREALMNDPKTNRLSGQDALPGNDRTDFDMAANKAGFTSLRQGNLGNSQYNDLRREQAKKQDQKDIEKQAQELHAQGLFSRDGILTSQGNRLMKQYVNREGDPDKLISRVVGEAENMGMNKQQRLQGIPSDSLDSIYKYKNYERSRKYNNAN